ncbi:MAG: AAA family ATPase [Pirellulales bacterium]
MSAKLFDIIERTNAKECGGGQYMGNCPAHDDSKASLAIHISDDGTIALHCHAGCAIDAVVAALGLTMADLAGRERDAAPARKIVATYDYHDAAGVLSYQVVRFEPKDFRQRRPIDGGKWEWSTKGLRPLPYKLPELLAADRSKPVWCVEGERDADNLIKLGLVATCNSGGAGKFRPELAEHFRDRVVIVLPDNDQPGRDHAASVAKALAGVAASVKVLELPGLPEKGDVSDWLAAGGTVEKLAELAAAASEAVADVATLDLIPASKFIAATYPVNYIVEGVLVENQNCIIGGPQKTLKTTLALDLALSIATGTPFLNQFKVRERKRVAIISGESGEGTLQETYNRIAYARNVNPAIDDLLIGFKVPKLGSEAGLASLAKTIEQHRLQVVIIDPLYLSLMGTETRSVNAASLFDMGPLYDRISDACKLHGATPILLHHFSKGSQNRRERHAPPELGDLAMAGISEWARQWILLGRRSEYRADGNHELHLMIGGSAGHCSSWALDVDEGRPDGVLQRCYLVTLTPAEDERERQQRFTEKRREAERHEKFEAMLAAIVEVMRKYPAGETATTIGSRIGSGIASNRLRPYLETLAERGAIVECKVPKPCRGEKPSYRSGWRLAAKPDVLPFYNPA